MDGNSNSNQFTIPTFRRKERETTPDNGNANSEHALCGLPRQIGKRSRREMEAEDEEKGGHVVGSSSEADQKVDVVEKKIVELQRLVPGGESFGIEKLFEETASYILALQCQIKAMRFVDRILEGLEQKKRKCGG